MGKPIRPTKGQIEQLETQHIGTGLLMYKSGEDQVTWVEVYWSEKHQELRGLISDKPVLPPLYSRLAKTDAPEIQAAG